MVKLINEKTPELFWEKVKEEIMKTSSSNYDDLMVIGFKDSQNELEKWQKLSTMLAGLLSVYKTDYS